MKKQLLLTVFIISTFCIHAQLIDNFGLRIGGGLYNQNFGSPIVGEGEWQDPMFSFSTSLNAELNIGNILCFRPEIGYMQKRFTEYQESLSYFFFGIWDSDPYYFDYVFHSLSLDLNLLISPFSSKLRPYLLIGIKGNYLLKYTDGLDDGVENRIYNPVVVSSVIGIGVNLKDIVYIECNYQPGLTESFADENISIREHYVELSVGVKLGTLIKN